MRRVLPFSLVLLCVLLFAAPANAMPRFVYEILSYKDQIRPLHVFWAACFFFVVFIFGRYQEWRPSITLGAALLFGMSVGAFGIWSISGDFLRMRGRSTAPVASESRPAKSAPKTPKPVAAPAPADEPAEDAPAPAEAEAVAATAPAAIAGAGSACKGNSDCPTGTACVNVAGKRKCWQACGPDDACPAGFVCFGLENGGRVCAR